MLHISNRKVAGFNVRWASFRGFSILFNNRGDHCLQSRSPQISYLHNNISNDTALEFYKILEEGITRLDVDTLTSQFLFCALPSSTYHVTLWGGLNYRHISQIDPQYRSTAENWLSGLPESLCNMAEDILQLPSMSSLCQKRDWSIKFRFDRLAIWNNSVLVVALRIDADSVTDFEQLVEERSRLSTQFHNRFNVLTDSKSYEPHVSLGYFANDEGARKALDFVNDWNRWFSDALQNSSLTFTNASIYGLTDMITFFKLVD